MFTQRISMDCTKEQYEKYLRDELLKMGYEEYSISYWEYTNLHYVCNNFEENLGDLGTINKNSIENYNRHYLGSFNAPLFLALAAMTDKPEGNYGEYIIGLRSGNIYKMTEDDKILPEYNSVRKATKEEIMAKFGDVKTGRKIEYPLDVTCKTDDESYFYATEAQMISHLKSKGYKILKPKTWEEI